MDPVHPEQKENLQPSEQDRKVLLPKKYIKKTVVIGLLILSVVVFIALTSNLSQQAKKDTSRNIQATVSSPSSPCQSDTYTHKISHKVGEPINLSNKDYERLRFVSSEVGAISEITGITERIMTKSLSSSGRMGAFVTTNRKNDVLFENETRKVYLYFFDSKEVRQIYSLQTKTFTDNPDYTQGVVDVGFSNNEQMVAIMVSNGMYTYNIETKELSQEFLYPGSIQTHGIYSYQNPKFSNDDRLVVIDRGHYEGGSQILLNLATNAITDLKYSMYVGGKRVIGWYKNNMLVYHLDGEKSEILTVSPADLKESSLYTTDYSQGVHVIDVNNIYLYLNSSMASGKKVCNNIDTKYEVYAVNKTINIFNIDTKEIKNILSVDATESYGIAKGIDIAESYLIPIDGKKEMVVTFANYKDGEYFHIDSSTPNVIRKIVTE